MVNLAIIGMNSKFINYVKYIIGQFQIDFEIITQNYIEYNKYYNYVVLNSDYHEKRVTLNSGYCFVNIDNLTDRGIDIYGNIITYGFGCKNTVTVSSIDREEKCFVYCLQRYLNHNAFAMLEPEEIPVKIDFNSDDELYACMVGITIALLETNDISKIREKLSEKI